MRHKRKTPAITIAYKFWARPLGEIPACVWMIQRDQQALWARLVALYRETAREAREQSFVSEAKKAHWMAFQNRCRVEASKSPLYWSFRRDVLNRFEASLRQKQSVESHHMHKLDDSFESARPPIGYDGVVDAFGGTYHGAHYEQSGLAGIAQIAQALRTITDHAWRIIHAAATHARSAAVRRTDDGYYYTTIPLFDDDGKQLLDADGDPQVQRVRRWSRTVAARTIRRRVQGVIARAQAGTRVMLAARPLYDLLRAIGIVDSDPTQCITAGCGEQQINATGLLWLAGCSREEESASIAQAQAFADGGIDGLQAALRG